LPTHQIVDILRGSPFGPLKTTVYGRCANQGGIMNNAHWHLTLNHIPVVGSFFVLGLLAWALWRRSEELKRVSLGVTVLVALLSIPAYMTGEPAFEAAMEVMEATPEDEDPIVKAHENAAGLAFGGAALAGAVALAGLLYSRAGRKPVPSWVTITVLVLLAGTAGLMGRAANLGGTIRHPEIRTAPTSTESGKAD
jgi:hypothetical protein